MSTFSNPVLGQSLFSKSGTSINNAPDTDSRYIKYTSNDTTISPNLSHDHTRIYYVAPTGDTNTVRFEAPTNTEPRSLHWISLDNSNNGSETTKTFVFSADYVFLDDPTNTLRTYTINGGDTLVWSGTYYDGKLRLRVAAESD